MDRCVHIHAHIPLCTLFTYFYGVPDSGQVTPGHLLNSENVDDLDERITRDVLTEVEKGPQRSLCESISELLDNRLHGSHRTYSQFLVGDHPLFDYRELSNNTTR